MEGSTKVQMSKKTRPTHMVHASISTPKGALDVNAAQLHVFAFFYYRMLHFSQALCFIPVNSSHLHLFLLSHTSTLSFFRVDNKVVFSGFLTAELTRISSERCTQYQIKVSTNI